jgi:hypothetical protein
MRRMRAHFPARFHAHVIHSRWASPRDVRPISLAPIGASLTSRNEDVSSSHLQVSDITGVDNYSEYGCPLAATS